ncbi:MAG TPA: xanthine dehydrogenase family protein molybdopterin-binding subunit [Candidatus Udaeobacter sp.]|jgi:xanthine dehydrogenase YagR molybdenum-binding subunit|nr:xanthine dehydrogenase family protein molybdopterin-binding subunit [Candidatus Udaeobacter sp.]
MNATTSIGQPLTRLDGRLKVTGAATYAAEFQRPGLAYAALIQSAIANGRVTKIDVSDAKSAPGVIGVLTRENAPHFRAHPDDFRKPGAPGESRVPLQDDNIYWAGQHLGLVVAETFEDARYAASLVRVTYQAQPAVVNLDDQRAQKTAGYPEKFAGREELQVKRGDVDAALATAAHKIDVVYSTPVENHNPIEGYSTTAEWEAPDRLLIHECTRGIKQLQRIVANAFGLSQENVRIICPFIGGAFGSKAFQWSHTLLAAAAAKLLERPVKLALSRQQMFDSAGQRARTQQRFSIGTDQNGKLLALRHATTTHSSPTHEYTEACGNMSRMLYSCPNVEVSHRLVRLNLTTPCPMRAPGETPGVFALECALDELAHEIDMDPVEFRLRNYAEIDEFKNRPWSSKKLRECYRRGAEKFGWSKRNRTPGSMRAENGSQIGFGMATAIYPAGQQKAGATAILNQDGTVTVRSATHEIGTGTYTAMSQFAADTLGIPIEKIRFELGDSQFPYAPNNGGSWLTASVGPAVMGACKELRRKVVDLTGSWPDDSRALADLFARAGQKPLQAEFNSEPDKQEREKFSFFSYGAVFVEVHVDPFGQVRVKRATGVYDMGRMINPRLARTQISGGMLFAFSTALMEATVPDEKTGRNVNPNFAEYHILVHADTPEFDIDFIGEPDPHMPNPGARGIGEIGIVGAPAAVANAIFNATGKRVRDLPITPDKLI